MRAFLLLIATLLTTLTASTQTPDWEKIYGFENESFGKILSVDSGYFCGAAYGGGHGRHLWFSPDLLNWEQIATSFPSPPHIAFGQSNNGTLHISTSHNGFYQSTNGTVWSPEFASGFGCASNGFESTTDGYHFTGVGGFLRGMHVSSNDGISWSNNYGGKDFYGMEWLDGTDLVFATNSNLQLFQSSNKGASWSQISIPGSTNQFCDVKEVSGEIQVLASDGSTYAYSGGGWTSLGTMSIASSYIHQGDAFISTTFSGEVWSTYNDGIFISHDGGSNWTNWPAPNGAKVHGAFEDNGVFVASTSDGLYRLTPAGPVIGCTDLVACNYDATATEDDGSCTYADYGKDCNGDCEGSTQWFVDATADPTVATGEMSTPFATIQGALDMACPSDTVLIAPGTYVENVSSTVENITIRGYAPSLSLADVAANVIIDGNALGTALFISGPSTSVSDVSITNGLSSFGAGLYMSGAHGSVVQRCQIRDNHAAGDITGHGLALLSNNCLIENCTITENHGTKHTVDSRGSNNTIKNCRITDNIATAEGGGVVVYTQQMLIQDCIISDNQGGGLTTYQDDTVIDHCTISGNTNFGIFIWGGYSGDAAIFISNSVISNPSTEFKMRQTGNIVTTAHLRHSIVDGGIDYDWISVYKVFDVDGTLNTLDPALLSDYTLASSSSAIGTAGGNRYDFAGTLGTPSSTLDLNYAGRPQPAGTNADLGALEHPLGTPEPTFGCTDDTACNYNPAATDDDASCIAPKCDDPTACNYDANATCGGGTCIPSGCMEEDACNYNPDAQCDGEACDYTCCPGPGCCDDPSHWDAALQQCNTAAPDTIVVTDTLLVPTPFCGAGTHWDPVTEMCIADVPGTTDENCTVMNLQELAEGYQVLLEHSADQDSIILAQQATIDALDAVCGCSAPVSYQGHDYEVVEIGGQCWFAENLQSASYRNGDAIPVLANSDWDDTPNGSQAAFDSDEANVIEYGLLYNWHAIDDPRRLCPSGWHVPDDAEWQVLIDGIGAQGGLQLKASSGWTAGPNGTDAQGFDGRPAGYRSANGVFSSLGALATWWSATPNDNGGDAHVKSLIDNSDEVYQQQGISRQQGRSIRCLKN